MEKIRKLFAEAKYEEVKKEIYLDPGFQTNVVKLRYLISACFYSRDYKGSVAAIEMLQPIEPKIAYSMQISTEISLGSRAKRALEFIERYLNEDLLSSERNWAYFQKGLCYLGIDQKNDALRLLEKATPLENDTMEAERHFFLQNSQNKYQGGSTALEKINEMIIESRVNQNAPLAKEARMKAKAANYGEGEYFAAVVLAKYFDLSEERQYFGQKFGRTEKSIYYGII